MASPKLARARDGYYALQDLDTARLQKESADMALRRAVAKARTAAWSWADIGETLGVDATTARLRYRKQGVY